MIILTKQFYTRKELANIMDIAPTTLYKRIHDDLYLKRKLLDEKNKQGTRLVSNAMASMILMRFNIEHVIEDKTA